MANKNKSPESIEKSIESNIKEKEILNTPTISINNYKQYVNQLLNNLKTKVSINFKNSIKVGIYKKDEILKAAGSSNIRYKKLINLIDSEYILGIKLDYFNDETNDILSEETVKTLYNFEQITDKTKDKNLIKISKKFEKAVIDTLGKTNINSEIIKFRCYLIDTEHNEDANFDSFYIFAGINISEKTSDNIEESDTILKEDEESKNEFIFKLVNTAYTFLGKNRQFQSSKQNKTFVKGILFQDFMAGVDMTKPENKQKVEDFFDNVFDKLDAKYNITAKGEKRISLSDMRKR